MNSTWPYYTYKYLTLDYVNLTAPFLRRKDDCASRSIAAAISRSSWRWFSRVRNNIIEFDRNLKQQNQEDVIHRDRHLEDFYSLIECSKIWTWVHATHFSHYWISIIIRKLVRVIRKAYSEEVNDSENWRARFVRSSKIILRY